MLTRTLIDVARTKNVVIFKLDNEDQFLVNWANDEVVRTMDGDMAIIYGNHVAGKKASISDILKKRLIKVSGLNRSDIANCILRLKYIESDSQKRYFANLNVTQSYLLGKAIFEHVENKKPIVEDNDDTFVSSDVGTRTIFDGIMLHTVYIPERKYAGTIIPKILNSLLWLTFLPIFLYGLFRLSRYDIEFGMNCNYFFANVIIGIVGGLLLGMILHEVGHAIACLANMKGAFLEAGFMIRGILPGAYVMIDATDVTNRRKKAQIYLAGIEVNLLLSGLLMILMTSVRENSFLGEWKIAMLYAVVQNVILTLINISLVENFDGEHTMRALFGGPIVDAAKANLKQMFSSKKRRNYFRKNGINGIANICTSVVVLVFQIFIPLLILAEISIFVGGVFS